MYFKYFILDFSRYKILRKKKKRKQFYKLFDYLMIRFLIAKDCYGFFWVARKIK